MGRDNGLSENRATGAAGPPEVAGLGVVMGTGSAWRRTVLAGAPHLPAVAPAVLTMLVRWDRLPERPATRFAFDGSATAHLSRPALLVTTIGVGVVLTVLFGVAARSAAGTGTAGISRWDGSRVLVVCSWAVAGLLGVVLFLVVETNIDTAGDAVSLPAVVLLYALGAAVVTGAVGALLAPRSRRPGRADREPPPADRAPVDRDSWSRTTGAPWMTALGAVCVTTGIVLGWWAGWLTGGLVVVAGLLLLLASTATVTVDGRGTTVAFTPFGWPLLRIGLDETESASSADVSPAEFGGWGYRVVPGASGLVLRSGPALVVLRRSGRRFVVTVDDARTAARVLNSLLGRRA